MQKHDWLHDFELMQILTQKEIKVRYKNSFLGYFWSIGQPLVFACILFFVFKIMIRFPIPRYILFLISGLFPWQAFHNSLIASSTIFLANASLIKRVRFSRYTLVLALMLNDTFHLLMSIPVIIFFLAYYRQLEYRMLLWLVYIPLNLFCQLTFTFGLMLIIASINLFFRDLERLILIFLNFLFYLTPIIYSPEMIPSRLTIFLWFNPAFLFIKNWRSIWMHCSFDWIAWSLAMVMGILSTIIGAAVYTRLNPKFSEVL